MSKSKGEFLTVSLLESKGYNPLAYRMFCLQSHYRKPLTFTYESLDNTTLAYNKLVARIAAMDANGEVDEAKANEYIAKFKEALDNDLNTSLALTCVYDVLKADTNDATKLFLLKDFDRVLSLNLIEEAEKIKAEKAEKNNAVDAEKVEALIAERTEARKNKDWATADRIRDELNAMHIVVTDTPEGIKWHVAG